MPALVVRLFVGLLLFVHAGLGLWAIFGMLELFIPGTPWPSVTNPELPRWLLWMRWPLIGAASCVFILGYLRRWRRTPEAMLIIYATMAAMCAYETFFVLTSPNRYRAMAVEYVEYGVILLFLFRSDAMKQRFARVTRAA